MAPWSHRPAVRRLARPILGVSVASLSLIGEDLDLDVLFARRPRTKWAPVLILSALSVFVTAGSAPRDRGAYFLFLLVGVLGPFFVHRRLEHPPAGPRTAGGALSVTQWVALWAFAEQVGATIREFVPSLVARRLLPELPAVATLPDSDDQRALPALDCTVKPWWCCPWPPLSHHRDHHPA